jgi:hypothetical protein
MEVGAATAETGAGTAFASPAEMRHVLTDLLTEIEKDSELGRRMRSAHVSYRYVFTDVDLTLNIASSEKGAKSVRWSFAEKTDWEPELTLEMNSEVANRYLQGRENLAIAVARRRIRCSCDARAALSLLPINRELSACYRQVLERGYPHLLLS